MNVINQSLPFKYATGPAAYNTAEVFYARLDPEIGKVDELLKAIYYLLWFPGYFGFNWDALYDCLCDLDWIPCRKVVLVHDGLPKISDHDLKTYLEILRDSVLDWGGDEDHLLEAVFQESDRIRIESLLAG
jgi:hypothetical protein